MPQKVSSTDLAMSVVLTLKVSSTDLVMSVVYTLKASAVPFSFNAVAFR